MVCVAHTTGATVGSRYRLHKKEPICGGDSVIYVDENENVIVIIRSRHMEYTLRSVGTCNRFSLQLCTYNNFMASLIPQSKKYNIVKAKRVYVWDLYTSSFC